MTAPKPRPRVSRSAIADAFHDPATNFPPVLTTEQAAALLIVPLKTIRNWLAQGRLNDAARKRGRRWFIWRDALIDNILNGAEWQ